MTQLFWIKWRPIFRHGAGEWNYMELHEDQIKFLKDDPIEWACTYLSPSDWDSDQIRAPEWVAVLRPPDDWIHKKIAAHVKQAKHHLMRVEDLHTLLKEDRE